ncbi:MAG TPA: metalloregulator ArsR/SmtB family transcription factor [Magnetospirillum sp.]|jgi:DNA-binding transcriptional ArsR family regulator|nr:metalloregulator ArsR/SmtB family transcription factor [Magnetospirillum sp.]
MRRVASDEEQIAVITETFRLLGDPTRLRILLACLFEPKCVNDAAAEAGVSASLTSHHLRLLRGARLVRAERVGRQIFYSAADAHVNGMLTEMVAHMRQAEIDDGTAEED